MFPIIRLASLAVLVTCVFAIALSQAVKAQAPETFRLAQASGSGVTEKEAFEAAKELGTIEAWEAFLNNFPEGFRADLARAYVRRLGREQKPPEKTAAPAPVPAAPSPQPQQAATPAPLLSPVDMGPGTAPWRIGAHIFDGGSSTTAAIVDARGVRLTVYCTAQRTIPLLVSGMRNGIYPEFDKRIEHVFAAAGGSPNAGNSATIPSVFRNGRQVFVSASLQGLTGELVLGDSPDGFNASSPVLEQIMSGNGLTVSMPPFGATFQLSGSRNAMCALLRSCGAAGSQPGCAAPAPRPVVNTPAAAPRPRPQRVNCTAGRVFSSSAGKCVCPRSAPHFYGGRCRPGRDCPGDSVLNSRGQCVKENEPPRQQQVDTCPGDSVRNAQGICVKENEPPQNNAQKLQCGLLQVACAAGNKNACNNMASACR